MVVKLLNSIVVLLGFGIGVKFSELLFWWIMKLFVKGLIWEGVFENVVSVMV